MNILILGGTVFLGRHIVEAARARGHNVTIFTRGQHGADLFPDVEKLRGDRDGNLAALEGRRWDAVIDTSGYVPRIVRQSAEALKDSAGHYTFISTLSVYPDMSISGINEETPVATMEDERIEEVTGETYGPLKVLCERAVEDVFPGRALIIRPGLIVGPNDPTDRFTYWPHRIAEGGEVLAPGGPEHGTQVIDVRDLSEWTVRMVEEGRTGVYNATGPDYRLTLGTLFDTCKRVSGSDATFTWIPDETLLARGAGPWMEVPLWMPASEWSGFDSFDVRRAVAAGLTFRPIEETVRDTLAWDATRPTDGDLKAGMSRERERELLSREP
jgi:2'-hydroxyisoflavone reductase